MPHLLPGFATNRLLQKLHCCPNNLQLCFEHINVSHCLSVMLTHNGSNSLLSLAGTGPRCLQPAQGKHLRVAGLCLA